MSFPLVDYGSGSDSENDEDNIPTQAVPKAKNDNNDGSTFFDNYGEDDDNNTGMSHGGLHDEHEGELEDIVKPKDWELKLAKKAQKELKKKNKKEKKEKKHKKDKDKKKDKKNNQSSVKPKEKAKISAFGALSSLTTGDSDDEKEKPAKPTILPSLSTARATGLLSMLPTPKVPSKTNFGATGDRASMPSSSLIPAALRNKQPAKVEPIPKRKAESDDSDDDDNSMDFFGLSSAPEPKVQKLDNVPIVGTSGLSSNMGPALPGPQDYVLPEEAYPEYNESGPSGAISNEQAVKLLARDETIQFMERRSLTDIASNLLEVRVDDALGPNVKQTLLKNITKKAIIKDTMAPLPKNKGPVDPNARKKNQITYLANLAVDREEALQEQWSESKQMKRMTRQKYGF